MPVFDFKCPQCGYVHADKVVAYREVDQQTCPVCQTLMERQLTVNKVSFLFNYFGDED